MHAVVLCSEVIIGFGRTSILLPSQQKCTFWNIGGTFDSYGNRDLFLFPLASARDESLGLHTWACPAHGAGMALAAMKLRDTYS